MAVIPRHSAAGRPGTNGLPSSVAEIGRLLRRTRTRQGLRLEEVALRTGLPVTQLEALESGTVGQIPDRVVICKTLRRYGDALGLAGDRLVLALIDLWPAPAPSTSTVTVPDAAVAAPFGPGTYAAAADTEAVLVGAPAGGSLYAEFDTQAVPQVFAEDDPTMSNPSGPPPLSGAFVDTGVNAAVGRGQKAPRPRSSKAGTQRAPLALRLLVGVVALAVVLASAGLVIYALKPSWFHQVGIGRSSPTTTTLPSHRPAPTRTPTSTASPLTVSPTGSDTATVAVRGTAPTVRVAAVGGDCWVSVTDAQQNTVFSNTISAGSQQDFPIGQQLTVLLGSGAGQTTLLQGTKVLGTYTPPNAPFTVTFTPAS